MLDNSGDLFPDLTPESVEEQILQDMTGFADVREGSYTRTIIAGISQEIYRLCKSLNELLPIAFPDETAGGYLEERCREFGIERKPGLQAQAVLTITGTEETVILKGTTFSTVDGMAFTADKEAAIVDGTASVPVTALEVGSQYNVVAGKIISLVDAVIGVQNVTNAEAAAGGADPETDEGMLQRLNELRQKPATSGNVNHYVQWALSVPGVGGAKADPAWKGGGTVRVLLVGNKKEPVGDSIVQSCKEYIETQRPICVDVTVASAKATPIHVAAVIETEDLVTKEKVLSEYKKQLETYLQGVSFVKYLVLYNRLAFLLLGIDGVVNYTSFTVNGGAEDIVIDADSVPTLGEVTIK